MSYVPQFVVDEVVPAPTTEMMDTSLSLMGAEVYHRRGIDGTGVRAMVLDTGAPQHDKVKPTAIRNFTRSVDAYDRYGHGSHVAGIIGAKKDGKPGVFGLAPGCSLYIAKVLEDDGGALDLWDNLGRAIQWAMEQKIHLINMSLSTPFTPPDSFKQLVAKAYAAGITFVATPGNTGREEIRYPGSLPEVMPVAALEFDKTKAAFSTTSPKVEIAAPGVRILSTYMNNQYARMSGTSMAAPAVTALLALLIHSFFVKFGKYPTPETLRLLTAMFATDLGVAGRDNATGYGFAGLAETIHLYGMMPKRKAVFWQGDLRYQVNGAWFEMDQAPVVVGDRTLMPVRAVCEALGANVIYLPATETSPEGAQIRLVLPAGVWRTAEFRVGSKTYLVDGIAKSLDIAPEMIGGRLCVPARAAGECMGAVVNWDPARPTEFTYSIG